MSAALFVNGINAGKLIPETAQYRFVVRVGRLLASVGRFGLLLRLVQGIDRRIGRRRIGFLSVSSLFPGFQPGDDRVPVHRSRRVRRGRSVFFVFDEQSGVFYVGVFPDIRRDQAQPGGVVLLPVGQYLVKDKIFVCSRARPVCFIGGGFHPRDVAGLQQKSGQDAETACNVFHRRNGVLFFCGRPVPRRFRVYDSIFAVRP